MSPEAAGSLALDGRVVPGAGDFAVRARITARPGEVLALLGPNGAGKTTLLRAIAGLTPLAEGRIDVGGTVVDEPAAGHWVTPQQRRVGVVFQDYRLFPTMTVLENVAFGPRSRGVPRLQARAAAAGWLDRLGLGPLAARRPRALSGGQAQRVALARALATDPAVLVLDEPLAALDAHTRGETRVELAAYLAAFAGPTLLVTHDPLDALVLADRVVVLEAGTVVQDASPEEITRRPATAYVATLMGLNHYAGTYDASAGSVVLAGGGRLVAPAPEGTRDGDRVLLAVRPSAITVHLAEPHDLSSRNVWPGQVRGLQLLGDRVRVDVAGAPGALVDLTPAALRDLRIAAGSRVWLSTKATEIESYH